MYKLDDLKYNIKCLKMKYWINMSKSLMNGGGKEIFIQMQSIKVILKQFLNSKETKSYEVKTVNLENTNQKIS